MTEEISEQRWLTIPDLVEVLGVGQSRVRRLIEDRQLVAVRRDGVLQVPAAFLEGAEPLHELRGTLFVLADAGFNDDEAVAWLLDHDEILDAAPIEALRAGRKSEVRRVAQALA
ncbi:MAG: Rv2175c family DNA-binding protein [Leifsonia sp.]